MPIRNVANLLENVVLVEAARLVLTVTGSEQVMEFVNPFAMPPLSAWQNRKKDHRGFNRDHLAWLAAASDRTQFSTYMALLATTLRSYPDQGPNGALLVGLLARQVDRRVRMWLNDLPDAQGPHYPNAIAGLRGLLPVLDRMCPTSQSRVAVEVCDVAYPDSLDQLSRTILTWRSEGAPAARLGYLDPMKYSIAGRKPNQTSRDDYRRWLRLLEHSVDGPVVSVHFTGNPRYSKKLGDELNSMFQDGADGGYDVVGFRHGGYAVVVHVKNRGISTSDIRNEFLEKVKESWRVWFQSVKGVRSLSALSATTTATATSTVPSKWQKLFGRPILAKETS
jgi:hypothetical protein